MTSSVTLLIDELGAGGAERQMCLLALELAKRNYKVQIACYHPNMWYQKHLLGDAVPVQVIEWRNKMDKIWKVYQFLRKEKSDVVISFLKGPNALNVLSRFPFKFSKIVVSERSADLFPFSMKTKSCFFLYTLADAVIVNSYDELHNVRKFAPYLSHKVRLIQSGVDLNRFVPAAGKTKSSGGRLIFGVFGSYSKRKRIPDLILAVEKISKKIGGRTPYFIWYGEYKDSFSGKICGEFEEAVNMISEKRLGSFFDLRGPTPVPEEALRELDCVCLTSEEEGSPNSIMEAFASGKPVIATRVGDVPLLVAEGKTGFLAEPKSPDSLASALMKMILLDEQKRMEMGQAARRYAEQNLSIEKFCDKYVDIIGKTEILVP